MLTRQNIHHLCPKCLIFVLLSKSETQIILNKVFFTELSDVQTDGGHKKGLFLSLDFPFFFVSTAQSVIMSHWSNFLSL